MEMTKLQRWYKDNIYQTDDEDECIKIAELSIKALRKNFNIGFTSPELVLSFYSVVYYTILEVLKNKRDDFNEYRINMAGRFEIGYSDAEDDGESEKLGSFVPFMFNIDDNKKDYIIDEMDESEQRCVQWNSINITEQTEIIKEISSRAVKNIKDILDVHIGSAEIVIPVFITIHEQMISYLKLTIVDLDEYEKILNFAGNFDVVIRKNEDGDSTIEYSPNITMKLDVKSDSIATSKFE